MLRELVKKYWDVIPYLFFGVCTTIVNAVVYWFCAHPLHLGTMTSTVLAWLLAVLFAYVTNRKWVFHSKAHDAGEIGKELISFLSCRVATGVVDWLCMFFFVECLGLLDVVVKVADNVLVVVLNYVASRLVIFKKR